MKKILLPLIVFLLLHACAQPTALLGPAITIGNSGNVMQAGFSYGSNLVIEESTGKTLIEHFRTYFKNSKKQKK